MYKLLCVAFLLLFAPSAISASFDCGKARSSMEKLICSDGQLSQLDEALNTAYGEALTRSPDKAVVRQWQQDWLSSNEVTGCQEVGCMKTAISNRIDLLNAVASRQDRTSRWNGRYVRFSRKDKTNSAELLLVGLSDNRVYISGSAIWQGPRASIGQVNTGEIEGIAHLKDGRLEFDRDGCKATLSLRKSSIAVQKESGCGGLNVSFVGEYPQQ